ncbi:MAG TPA: cyclic pyranopterin monophosphate synthase MoaC [Bacteroidales bacterium]|nr:cyclic pyranopterin monophosphate synthase MoaC [Bacteroidales bacterium]
MTKLSHTDDSGKARMVDVGDKPIQKRLAVARGKISMSPNTLQLIRENQIKKGEVLTIAEIAAIQAAKDTSGLIPLCHPLQITNIQVTSRLLSDGVEIEASVQCQGQTGVEMEALTAVSVGLLTVYDMCKAADKNMTIQDVRLVEKKKE